MKDSPPQLINVFRAYFKFFVVIGAGAAFQVLVNVVSDVSSECAKRQLFEVPASQQVASTSGSWAVDMGWKDGSWAVDTSWDTNWGYDGHDWDAGWGSQAGQKH